MGRPCCRSWSAAMGVAAKQATWEHTAGQSRSCSDSCWISADKEAEHVRRLPGYLQTQTQASLLAWGNHKKPAPQLCKNVLSPRTW